MTHKRGVTRGSENASHDMKWQPYESEKDILMAHTWSFIDVPLNGYFVFYAPSHQHKMDTFEK